MDDTNKSLVRKLDRGDLYKFHNDIINQWNPSSEVWAFKHGDDLTTGAAALTSLYFTHYFRKQLKLRAHAKLTCFTPVVGLAAVGCYVAQAYAINLHILSGESCPLCITTRAITLQLASGLLYPLVMAPIVTFYMADRLLTYPVPSISQAPKEVCQLFWKLIRKNPRPVFIAAAAHVFVTSLVTQQKMAFVHRHWSS